MKKYWYVIASLALFVISFAAWQVSGSLAEESMTMDETSSLAISSFLLTVFFFFTTLVALVVGIVKMRSK